MQTWSQIYVEASCQKNFNFGFASYKIDNTIHLSEWQYWFWFWFAAIWSLYFIVVLEIVLNKNQFKTPIANTSIIGHGKVGDFLVAIIPLTWCGGILVNSNYILRMIEWQNEESLFTVRIQGKQWYWVYKYSGDITNKLKSVYINIGNNNWKNISNNQILINNKKNSINTFIQELEFKKNYKNLLKINSKNNKSSNLYNLNNQFYSNNIKIKNINNINKINQLNKIKIFKKNKNENIFVKEIISKFSQFEYFNSNLNFYRKFFFKTLFKIKNKNDLTYYYNFKKTFNFNNLNYKNIIFDEFLNDVYVFNLYKINKILFTFSNLPEMLHNFSRNIKLYKNIFFHLEYFRLSFFKELIIKYYCKINFKLKNKLLYFYKNILHFDNNLNYKNKILNEFLDKVYNFNFYKKNKIIFELNNFENKPYFNDKNIIKIKIRNFLKLEYFELNLNFYKKLTLNIYHNIKYKLNNKLLYFYKNNLYFTFYTLNYNNIFLKEIIYKIYDYNFFKINKITDNIFKIINYNQIIKMLNYNLIYTLNFKKLQYQSNLKFLNFSEKKFYMNYQFNILDEIEETSSNIRINQQKVNIKLLKGILNKNNKILINSKNIKKNVLFNIHIFNNFNIEKISQIEDFWGFRQKKIKKLKSFNIKKSYKYIPNKKFTKLYFYRFLGCYRRKSNKFIFFNSFKINKKKTELIPITLSKRLLRLKKTLILPTHLNLTLITNSYDVVHSWFVPGLGLKIDCVPGRSTHHSLYIENVGIYNGQCAEICGRYHHHMPIRVCAILFEHFLFWWYKKGMPRIVRLDSLKKSKSKLYKIF